MTGLRLSARARQFIDRLCRRWPRLAGFLGFAQRRRRPLWALFFVLMHVLGFLHSISAVMETRTPQGAIAWAISLNTMPVVAVPAYWVFGENNLENYSEVRRRGRDEVWPLAEGWLGQVREARKADGPADPLLATLGTISSMPVTAGNHCELLVDGRETFDAIFEAIESAEDYVLVQFYIIRADETGNELKRRLIERAREGVRVHLLFDDVGCLDLPDEYRRELSDAGVRVTSFMNPEADLDRFQLNFRNHRKLVVVDGHTAFVGGNNVGDEYIHGFPGQGGWRDAHMKVSGPAATSLQVPFLEDWKWATGEAIEGLAWDYLGELGGSGVEAVGVATGPADEVESCGLYFHAAIRAANERIWIATPYFVPDEALVQALQLAAMRGVEVRILIPDQTDSWLVQRSSYSYLEELGLENIEIRRHEDGFLHKKVLLIDDRYAVVGSANVDNRSIRLNFELSVAVADEGFAGEVRKMLEHDFAHSRKAEASDLRERSFWFRFTARIARLLAPVQ